MRATKNLEQAETQYCLFIRDIVSPMFVKLLQAEKAKTVYMQPLKVSKRFIGETYGFAARDVFSILFKLIKRGGYSKKTSQGYHSIWVANDAALEAYVKFSEEDGEKTCRALKFALLEDGCVEVEYDKMTSSWLPKAVRAATMDGQRKLWVQQKHIKRTKEEQEHYNATYH